MNARHNRGLVTCIVTAVLAGCTTLPGYHRTDYDESSRWFGTTGATSEESGDLDPVVMPITPSLIVELAEDRGIEAGRLPTLPASPPTTDYAIGPGDLLSVVVYGHPDITNPAGLTQAYESAGRVVDADGNIFIPFTGTLNVSGLTAAQARELVANNLKRVINDPQVDIRVLQFRSKKVYITGDIAQPCTVPLTDVPTSIVDALTACRAQLLSEGSEMTAVSSVILVRDNSSYPIDLASVYRRGAGPVLLQDGDRVIVDNRFNRVFLIGEFLEQRTVPMAATSLTLADAMAAAGGLNLETANSGAIFVIRGFVETERGSDGGVQTLVKPTVYHLNASSVDAMILADQFYLQPRDVVYAAPAGLVNFNRALAQITPSIDALFRSVLIIDRTK